MPRLTEQQSWLERAERDAALARLTAAEFYAAVLIGERDALAARLAAAETALREIANHDQDQGCDGDCALLMVNIARAALVSEPTAEEREQ